MHALTGPVLGAAGLLVAGGLPKLVRPAATTSALSAARLPGSPWLVRALGAGEVAVGLAAILAGGRLPAALLAAAYLGFTGFVLAALRRGAAGCGCFGRDTPPTRVHVVVDLLLAALAGAAAVTGADSLPAALAAPAHGVVLAALAGGCGWLAYLALTRLPALGGARPVPTLAPARPAVRR